MQRTGDAPFGRPPRIGILIVAYNAALTLHRVLDRIPPEFRERTAKIFVCDDFSHDSTYLVGLGYQQTKPELPLEIVRNPRNLGYGGNQKLGYRLAIEHDLDIVVLLHGDGQYAPECIEDVVGPLERGQADAVLGSRMMTKGAARKGGMPLYKFIGNRILTTFENFMLGTNLTEFHSGYRAYSVRALRSIPFERNSDDFDFDTEIIIQFHASGKRIVEVPIPTYYGDEICYVNGMKYARDVCTDVLRYRLSRMGFLSSPLVKVDPQDYTLKGDQASSHGRILEWLSQLPSTRVLDLGCSAGRLAERARDYGHEVTGVDVRELEGVSSRVDRFVAADLDAGIPADLGGPFDVVIAADVLEHLRDPLRFLTEVKQQLGPGGVIMLSVPNFGHWYPRVRTFLGLFDYDQRGILDSGHVRFFTRHSLERLIGNAQMDIVRREVTGLPVELLVSGSIVGRFVKFVDRFLTRIRPTLFAYQFVYELRATYEPVLVTAEGGLGLAGVG